MFSGWSRMFLNCDAELSGHRPTPSDEGIQNWSIYLQSDLCHFKRTRKQPPISLKRTFRSHAWVEMGPWCWKAITAEREYIIYERFSLINLWNVLNVRSFLFSHDLVFCRSDMRHEFALWCAVSFLDCLCEVVFFDSSSPVLSMNHYLCQCLHSTCLFFPLFCLPAAHWPR